MKSAYIYDIVRTPRGRGHAEKGGLKDIAPIDLLKTLFVAIEQRNNLDTSIVEDVAIGCNTVTKEQGANIGKIAALYSGWHFGANGLTLSSFCTSGLEAVQLEAMKVMTGTANLCVAGGVESMSRVPMFSDKGPWFANREVAQKTGFIHMGLSAELIANQNGFSQYDLNEYSIRSHELAGKAWEQNYYSQDAIEVDVSGGLTFGKDELIRQGLTLEKMQQLPMVFNHEKDHQAIEFIKHHANLDTFKCLHSVGNAPGIADAASLLLIGDDNAAQVLKQKPLARITGFASASVHPVTMLTGVVDATQKVLDQQGLKLDEIDLFEVNESFAAIPLHYMKTLGVDESKVNVNGGAIAMGHPLGATGGILIGSLITELRSRGLKRGIATICGGAGIAQATLIEIV